MSTKSFRLGDILSITTRLNVSPRNLKGIHDILSFMVGRRLRANQLISAASECAPYLLKQMPWLKKIKAEGVNKSNYESWIREQLAKYGRYHKVRTIPKNAHVVIDPPNEFGELPSSVWE